MSPLLLVLFEDDDDDDDDEDDNAPVVAGSVLCKTHMLRSADSLVGK